MLNHASLESVIIHRVAARLSHQDVPSDLIRQAFADMVEADPSFGEAFHADLLAVVDRDPACTRVIEPILYFKGLPRYPGAQAGACTVEGRAARLRLLSAEPILGCVPDRHPSRSPHRQGRLPRPCHRPRVGSTALIEDNVSMLQDVTLGGTGKDMGDRHPKVRHGVLIGAGAKILGNIEIGHCARIAAGSVVLHPVPHNKTVAGVPARIVGEAGCAEPARTMDQILAAKPALETFEGRTVIEPGR